MALIGTMAALVLGLLVASAKGSYDARSTEVTQMAGNVVFLDRILAHYGPETKETREVLRRVVVQTRDQLWPGDRSRSVELAPNGGGEGLYDRIQALSPQNEAQRSLQAQAASIYVNLAQTRFLLTVQSGSSIPVPFLVVLIFWLAVIFGSWGLFAPQNATVTATLGICALSFACAIFLIVELDQPFRGLIRISSTPVREALAQLGR
jgi:hypothetical protein